MRSVIAWGVVAAAVAWSLPAARAAEIAFPAQDSGSTEFGMPSGNVDCIYIPAGGTKVYKPEGGGPELSCDRAAPSYVRVTLGRSGPAIQINDPGDQPCCSAGAVLTYGSTWRAGPFTCTSEQTGLTCSRDDGHGFSLSRATAAVH